MKQLLIGISCLTLVLLRPGMTTALQPSAIPGLKLWLDASVGVTTEDNTSQGGSRTDVRLWVDRSHSGGDVANTLPDRATRPQWLPRVAGIGGQPAIQFHGQGGSHFEVTESLLGKVKKPFDLNRATLFMVARWEHHGAMAPLVLSPRADHASGRGGVAIRRGGDPRGWFGVHNGGSGNVDRLQTIEPKVDDQYHVFAAVFDKPARAIRMFLDGRDQQVSIRNSSAAKLDVIQYVQIGGQGLRDAPGERGSEWYFGGQIAEIVVFDRLLKNDGSPDTEENEFNAVGWYLQQKYALTGAFIPAVMPRDTDRDGIKDRIEAHYAFLDANDSADAGQDFDQDGLTNLRELQLKTDLENRDTDGDRLVDGVEVPRLGTDPRKADTDGAGATDWQEVVKWKTHPKVRDTDRDGFPDGFEILVGTGPLQAVEKPRVRFNMQEEEVRVGTITVALDGTLLLFEDDGKRRLVVVKRSIDHGQTWGPEIEVGKMVKIDGDMSDDGRYRGPTVGWSEVGNVTVDETNGDVMVFASSLKPAPILYRSRDHGRTWKTEKIVIKPDVGGWLSATLCSSDPGITLKFGAHQGRLLMPTRVFVGYLNKGKNRKHFADHYSNALYSDDHGKTWTPSAPFPLGGTGESSLVELRDGRIYFNSRTHSRPGYRRVTFSHDGGETWDREHEDDELWDGPPDVYGCKSGLLRLPYKDRDILVFSSPGRRDKREDITVRVSLDGGENWPFQRLVRPGPGNYTWLAAGRPGTPSEGMIYLLAGKDWLASFNLAWVMEQHTGQ